MEDEVHKTGLYRWQRQTKPIVQSRSHRVKTSNDIQDWIKKVEEASNHATEAAFGVVPTGKQRGKMAAQVRIGQAREQEQAYGEAQDLLTQWMNEKVRFDDDDGYDDLEAWRRAREIRNGAVNNNRNTYNDDEDFSVERLTRLALEDDFEIDEAAVYERVKRNALGDEDPYANLYQLEEEEAVSTVLKNMMRKEVMKDTFKKDLGFEGDKAKPDPRTKMELRHKMVKENREKRQKEEERRRSEAQMKKEARLKAQQLILKEQKDRDARARREDMELKKEMAKIRKDMHEERKRKEEEMRKEREEREMLDKMAREELERQRAAEEKEMIHSHRLENERRKKQMMKTERVKARIESKNLQCLHRHLTAWYDLVLSRHLLMGKVKAMSDWKLMLKVWGAWRSHVRTRRLQMETEIHERNVIDAERKKLTAERHYTLCVLRKCFTTWQLFVAESVDKQELEKQQERTRNKMMSLLTAVAEGKMGKEDGAKKGGKKENIPANGPVVSARSTDSQKIDQMFQQPVRKQAWVDDENIQSHRSESTVSMTDRSSASRRSTASLSVTDRITASRPLTAGGPRSKGKSLPTQAWQVSRRHLNLSKEEIANLGEEGDNSSQNKHTDTEIRRRFGTQPWMNRHYVVNNFEHRYTAQQQALKEQQNQIREQKRLIEELQYEQRQQALKQQLLEGANAPPLPALEQPEAPQPGKEIPRGDEGEAGKITENRQGEATKNMATTAKRVSSHNEVIQGESNGAETERSQLTTSRSEQSTATNVTSLTSATKKTQNSRYLKVLKNMEERAAERARLKAERDEKRRKQEEEKLAEIQRLEEEKQKEIEAEKKAKAEAYRQKKQLEKQKEEERQRQLAHQEEMNKRADEHYIRSIKKYRGLLPFKKLISLSKRNWMKAVKHRDKQILRQVLLAWKRFAEDEANQKRIMADQMHQFLLTKHCFQKWRNYKYHQQFLECRAERHYKDNLRGKYFQAWAEWVVVERQDSAKRWEMAGEYFLSYLVKKTFLAWRHLPERLKREEERQKRKLELRQKVAELIPDFIPHESVKVDQSEELS